MATKQLAEMLHQDHPLAVVKEESPEDEPEISNFCYETVTKEELIIGDEEKNVENHPKSKRKRIKPEQGAEKGSKGGPHMNGTGSAFRYETVTKEELIIQDDAFDDSRGDEQEEGSLNSWEDRQSVKGGQRSRRKSQGSLPNRAASNQFKCDVCQKVFAYKPKLKYHKKLHEKSLKILECQNCHETFDDRYSLRMHNKIHQQRIKPQYVELLEQDEGSENYTCLLCDKLYTKRIKALAHVQEHMTVINGTFQCKICGLRCARKHTYQVHMAKNHKNSSDRSASPEEAEGIYTYYEASSNDACEESDSLLHCKTCDVFFNNKANLNIHLWKSKLKIIQLKIAADGKKLSEKKKNLIPYNNSKVETDKNGFYNCSQCDYQINQLRAFKRHVRAHKVFELGVHTCDVCQMRFTRKGFLDYHKKSHTGDLGFECQTCHEKFPNRSELSRHRYRAHPKSERSKEFNEKVTVDEKGVFTCPFCGKTDTNRAYAYQHFCGHVSGTFVCKIERKGVQEKRCFVCSICTEKFDTRAAYLRHRKSHNSNLKVFLGVDDLYHCTRCDETFSKIGLAYTHFKKHGPLEKEISKNHPFKCTVCNKMFHLAKDLQRCEYNHNVINLQKNKCETCGKCFTTKHRLTIHELIHKKEKQPSRSKKRKQKRNEVEEDQESTDSALSNEDDDK